MVDFFFSVNSGIFKSAKKNETAIDIPVILSRLIVLSLVLLFFLVPTSIIHEDLNHFRCDPRITLCLVLMPGI